MTLKPFTHRLAERHRTAKQRRAFGRALETAPNEAARHDLRVIATR